MAHRLALTLAAAALLLPAACRRPPASAEARVPPAAAPTQAPSPALRTVTLFFLKSDTGELAPVLGETEAGGDPAAAARRVLDLLLAGPKDAAFAPPVPPGTSIRGLYAMGSVLVADLALPPDTPPLEGTRDELDLAYAVTNTICLNVPEFQGVRLLLNGSDDSPLVTHLDLTRPLRPRQ